MTKKLTQEEAEEKSLRVGTKMLGKYQKNSVATEFECKFCHKAFKTRPLNVWNKSKISCGCQSDKHRWVQKEIKFLIDNKNMPRELLATKLHRSIDSVVCKLCALRLKSNRTPTDWVTCSQNTKLSSEHIQIIDGLMLGDGGLKKDGNMTTPVLSLTNIRKDWIDNIKQIPYNWREVVKPPRKQTVTIDGITRTITCKKTYVITSTADLSLNLFYDRWYPKGIKSIPSDIKLTPLVVKHWFYGDGCSEWHQNGHGTRIVLYTNGFTKKDVELLQNRFLIDANISFLIKSIRSKYYILRCGKYNEVIKFFNYIGKCDVKEFEYKWKIPKWIGAGNYKHKKYKNI